MSAEEWRPVVGYPDYTVSNTGRIRSTRPWPRGSRGERELRPRRASTGYLIVTLIGPGGVRRTRGVHQLVTEAFRGPRPEGQVVRHLDGNCLNNRAENLLWGTYSENNRDQIRHGTHPTASKTHCIHGHPLHGENISMYRGRRCCLSCRAVKNARGTVRRRERREVARAAS